MTHTLDPLQAIAMNVCAEWNKLSVEFYFMFSWLLVADILSCLNGARALAPHIVVMLHFTQIVFCTSIHFIFKNGNLIVNWKSSLMITSQMTQGTRRLYSEVEVKAKAEVKIVVRSYWMIRYIIIRNFRVLALTMTELL